MSSARERGETRIPKITEHEPHVRQRRRHDEAVVQAEVRRLARALRPFVVLHRAALAREARAERWHEGGFERALSAALSSGVIERLPADFYRRLEPREDASPRVTGEHVPVR